MDIQTDFSSTRTLDLATELHLTSSFLGSLRKARHVPFLPLGPTAETDSNPKANKRVSLGSLTVSNLG